jgi:hypothetical protein
MIDSEQVHVFIAALLGNRKTTALRESSSTNRFLLRLEPLPPADLVIKGFPLMNNTLLASSNV